jgi:hypothetical protein
MESLLKLKAVADKAFAAWDKVSPWLKKIGPNWAWFAAGFAAAKLLSCLLA